MLNERAMGSRGSVTVYFDPDRDGDINARIKAVGEARSGPYARVSNSEWGRRLLLERLAQLEAELGLIERPPAKGKRRKIA